MANVIFDKNTFIHFRLPFSFFLMPVFFFAIGTGNIIDLKSTIILFIALHIFIYPASNLYNSYMDKDEGSIGGLKNPPPATKKLYYASIIVDAIGISILLLISPIAVLLAIPYTLASRIYSWNKIRLKKYAVTGWLTVILFQGAYTYMLVNMCSTNNFSCSWFSSGNIAAMVFASLLIGAYYPLTQIYQHDEDSSRGDLTLSYKLGITGTFVFSALVFGLAFITGYFYYTWFYSLNDFVTFVLFCLPVIGYFLYWFLTCLKDPRKADFTHAMRMTLISSTCLLLCFLYFIYSRYQT